MRKDIFASALRTAGPAMVSLGNFATAAALQLLADPHQFGTYAFAMVLLAAWQAASTGLFGSTLLMLFSQNPSTVDTDRSSFATANLMFTLVGSIALPAACFAISGDTALLVPLFLLTAAQSIRNYIRSGQIAAGQNKMAVRSDLVYGIVTTVGVLALVGIGKVLVDWVIWLQLLATIAGIALSRPKWIDALPRRQDASLSIFGRFFRLYGSWALIGVVTTEITANAHAYLITIFLGPAAFAPIAAVTLMFRPVGVIALALTQFERPALARQLVDGKIAEVRRTITNFHVVLLAACGVNILLVVGVLVLFPGLVMNAEFGSRTIVMAAIALSLVRIVQMLRMPTSAALQAAGEFRTLARISLATAPFVIVCAGIPLAIAPQDPALSLFGALCGELVAMVVVNRAYKALLARKR